MPEKTPTEIVMEAFGEFKKANDENAKKRDVVLDDKLSRIQDTLDKFEPLNQKVTAALATQKSQQEHLDRIEKIMNRGVIGAGGGDNSAKEDAEYRAAFFRCLRRPADGRAPADIELINKRKAALVRGDDAGAGYLMAPPDVLKEIVKDIVEMSPMRSLATVRTIGGPSLKQPKRTAAAGAATRVGETQARTNTGDPAYGMVEFKADELFARAEISQQMLEDADYDLDGELRQEFAEQFAVKEGAEFISGTNASGQAEGILTNSAVAAVNSGAAAALTADGLLDLFYGLKTGYTRNAQFVMRRTTLRDIRKLKDGSGQYLWLPGIAGTVPNTILGATYVEMPDMPAVGAGTYPIAYGDFKRAYVIVDRVLLSIQTDYTTGADSGLVVFRARKRVGGGVRQADAIKKQYISA